MGQVERDLLRILVELDETVRAGSKLQPRPALLPMFQRIDQLTAELPAATDRTLLHYLHKKSYEKARLWLQGRDGENQAGNCGHV